MPIIPHGKKPWTALFLIKRQPLGFIQTISEADGLSMLRPIAELLSIYLEAPTTVSGTPISKLSTGILLPVGLLLPLHPKEDISQPVGSTKQNQKLKQNQYDSYYHF